MRWAPLANCGVVPCWCACRMQLPLSVFGVVCAARAIEGADQVLPPMWTLTRVLELRSSRTRAHDTAY